MDSKKFIELALRTESNDFPKIRERFTDRNIRLLHAAMGLCTEAAEFLDAMKKQLFYGKELDEINLLEEIGDQNWYQAIAADVLDKSFEEIWIAVINKLSKRYGIGFNEKGAISRNLMNERKILEEKLSSLEMQLGRSARIEEEKAIDCVEVVKDIFDIPEKLGES